MLDTTSQGADLTGLSQAVLGQALPLAELGQRLQAAHADPDQLIPLAQDALRMTARLALLTRQLQGLLKAGQGLSLGP